MTKVALIGAGSIGFTRGEVRDILTPPELRDSTEIALTDIDPVNLGKVFQLVKRDFAANGIKSKITATTDRRKALKNANYVFCFVRVGGVAGFKTDVEIPLKYGVDQCVGDTLCAGGIMYAQRTIPVLLEFLKDMAEVSAPGALFLNHANPMAMNTWACVKYGHGVETVGLCHGVEGGWRQIADVLGVAQKDVDIVCAGINHQTWYVKVLCKGRLVGGAELLAAFERHPVYQRTEKVRIDMLRRFGCYTTESNGHYSEYVPWYRKRPDDLINWIDLSSWGYGESCGYLRCVIEDQIRFRNEFQTLMKAEPLRYDPKHRGHEHGAFIIEAMETGRIYRGHFNRPNQGTITNLPADAIIEAPGYVDPTGLHMAPVGDLPHGCAAVLNASISVQRLGMEAAVSGDVDLLRQAFLMDPLVGAVCNPPEAAQLVDDMLIAAAQWLPQYKKAISAAKRRLKTVPRLPTNDAYQGAVRIPVENPDVIRSDIAARAKLPAPTVAVPRMKKTPSDLDRIDWTNAVTLELGEHPKGYRVSRHAQVRMLQDGETIYFNVLDSSDERSLSIMTPFRGDRWEFSVAASRTSEVYAIGVTPPGVVEGRVVSSKAPWKSGAHVHSVVEPHLWRLTVALPVKEFLSSSGKFAVCFMNIARGTIEVDLRPVAWAPTYSTQFHVAKHLGEVRLDA